MIISTMIQEDFKLLINKNFTIIKEIMVLTHLNFKSKIKKDISHIISNITK